MIDIFKTVAAHWDDILIIVGAVGVAAESLFITLASLCWALKKLADGCYLIAIKTSPQWDEMLFGKLSYAFEWLASFFECVASRIPRLRSEPRSKSAAKTGVAGAAVLALAIGLLSGCGGKAERATRTALDVTAHGIVASSELGSEILITRKKTCFETAGNLGEWHECMDAIFELEEALVHARRWLVAAESAVDVSGASGILGIGGCISSALDRVNRAIRALDIPVPKALQTAIDGAAAWGQFCNSEATR